MNGKRFIMAALIALILVSSLIIALAKETSTISISASPTTVTLGSSVTISGTIMPVRVNVDVTIWYRSSAVGTWTLLATVRTNSSSGYAYVWVPSEAGTYELKSTWPGDEVTLGAESAIVDVTVEGGGTIREYDPWCDIDDDGKIDIFDLALVAIRYGALGTPINKTALLLELKSKIDSLNASLVDLESKLVILNATKLGKPDFDSGWLRFSQGEEKILTHNLMTTNVLVYMVGNYSDSASPYIHQHDYGGEINQIGSRFGAWWGDLTETTIRVSRHGADQKWNWIRVLIWKIPA